MVSTTAYRIVQSVGWMSLIAAHLVVVGTIGAQSIGGPEDIDALMPSAGATRTLLHSFCIAGGAALVASAIGVVVACAAAQGRRAAWRTLFTALMLIAILTMPSIHAYAWQLLFTSQAPAVRILNDALVAAGPWGARSMSALALGMWLWPIPAWTLLNGLRRGGGEAMELALLDAGPFIAFYRGVLPLLRGPLIAGAAVVFVAAILDSTAAPLMLASDIWPVEMLREAESAMIASRPAGRMFWRSWPMLVSIGFMALLAAPELRRICANRVSSESDQPARRLGGRWLTLIAAAAAMSALLPVVVFIAMLSTDARYSISSAIQSVWRTAQGPAASTAVVAVIAAVLSFAVSVACELGLRARDSAARSAGRFIVGLTILTAVLPTALVGTSLVSFYAGPLLGNASGWNVYDDTPITWIAAMMCRFAFVPVCMIVMAGWAAPRSLMDIAELDAPSRIRAWHVGRWPFVRGAAFVGACVAGLLAFSEVQASALARAPRWGDDSLAVFLDSQMHYGRHGQTLALALLMYVPIVAICLVASIYAWTRERFERITR